MENRTNGLSFYREDCLLSRFALLLACAPLWGADAPAYSRFEAHTQVWRIGNGRVEAALQLNSAGQFQLLSLTDKTSAKVWRAPAGQAVAPFSFTAGGTAINGRSAFQLTGHRRAATPDRKGIRQTIDLAAQERALNLRLEVDCYPGLPFLRYRTLVQNATPALIQVTAADMLPWQFDTGGNTFRSFFVEQWSIDGTRGKFLPRESDLAVLGRPAQAYTGAGGDHCAWGAVRDNQDNGLVFGWEFDGRARAYASNDVGAGIVRLSVLIETLRQPLNPGETFTVPAAFLGVFQGDWDEAGHQTHLLVERVLATPVADDRFPYVMFDTWGYQYDIDEPRLMELANAAADLGAEVFTVDFGWARRTGDWDPDPAKFPHGLKPVAAHVRSLGMKFGLHLPFAEADPESAVLRRNPGWAVVNTDTRAYFGARGLCLAHAPAREWVISEILRVVRENDVDWLLQDGENMVKRCSSAAHTHHPSNSNYANAVEGLNQVLAAVRAGAPALLIENCEDGGNMQTFNMVRNYHTSIVNDNADMLMTRRSVYGATYPFPPRYTDRYFEYAPWGAYYTRSHFFGGPLILMQRITELQEFMYPLLKEEIALYKSIRGHIRDGKVYHLSRPPDGRIHDVMQSHLVAEDRSVILAFRPPRAARQLTVRPRGLQADRRYRVKVVGEPGDKPIESTLAGEELLKNGLVVRFPLDPSALVIHIDWTGEFGGPQKGNK